MLIASLESNIIEHKRIDVYRLEVATFSDVVSHTGNLWETLLFLPCLTMLLVALSLSLVFAAIGFIVTKDNASYLLSGYNTMAEQERQAVNITAYLRFFKRFHLVLAMSLLVGVCLLRLLNTNWASQFMTLFPLAAYSYFVVKTTSFYKVVAKSAWSTNLFVGVLIVASISVLKLNLTAYESNRLLLNQRQLEIAGDYGFSLNRQAIYRQRVVNELPPIAYRANGFSGGDYAKGRFRVKGGKAVFLFVNKTKRPYLLLETAKGDVYYNHDTLNMQTISQEIGRWLVAK